MVLSNEMTDQPFFPSRRTKPNRTWSKRRVIISSKVIIFAKTIGPDDTAEVLDAIPMFEIEEIRIWDADGIPRSDKETQGFKRAQHVGFGDLSNKEGNDESDNQGSNANSDQKPPMKFSKQLAERRAGGKAHAFTRSFSTLTGATAQISQRTKEGGKVQFRNTIEIRPKVRQLGWYRLTDILLCQSMMMMPISNNRTSEHPHLCASEQVNGYNSGRIYSLRAKGERECLSIAQLLADASKRARKEHETMSRMVKLQRRCTAPPEHKMCKEAKEPVQTYAAVL